MAITKVSASLVDLDGGVVINESSADADFRVESNGNANMLFVDGGNDRVGIGTNSPADTLHVAIDSGTTNAEVDVARIEATSSGTPAVGFGPFIDFRGDRINGGPDSYGRLGFEADAMPSTTVNGAFIVQTAADGTYSERMRINSSGLVSIGTTTTDRELKVQKAGDHSIIAAVSGTSNLAGMVMGDTSDDDRGAVLYNNNGDYMYFQTDAAERMRITSSGNLGIGASSALDNKLEVNGGDIRVRGTSTPTLKLNNGDQEVVGMRLQSGATGNLSFHTDKMAIDASGNVVVGHTAAILSASNRGNVTINGASESILSLGINGSQGGYLYHDGTTQFLVNTKNGGLRFATNNTEKTRIDSSGNFMHNTTSASTLFTIQGNTTADVLTVRSGSSADANVGVVVFRDGSAEFCGQITCNGSTNSVTYSTSSDARLKNVLGEAKGLEIINQLNPVHFEWKKSDIKQDGLIAQEVEPIVPNAVTYNEDSDVYQLDYSKLVTPLIKAIQELSTEVEELKTKLENK